MPTASRIDQHDVRTVGSVLCHWFAPEVVCSMRDTVDGDVGLCENGSRRQSWTSRRVRLQGTDPSGTSWLAALCRNHQ